MLRQYDRGRQNIRKELFLTKNNLSCKICVKYHELYNLHNIKKKSQAKCHTNISEDNKTNSWKLDSNKVPMIPAAFQIQ